MKSTNSGAITKKNSEELQLIIQQKRQHRLKERTKSKKKKKKKEMKERREVTDVIKRK